MSAEIMRLAELLDSIPPAGADIDVVGLTADSRQVRPGYLFAALRGQQSDGAAFVPDALARGAVAVLASPAANIRACGAAVVTVENPRQALARLAARFFAHQPAFIVGVTGTNGKTSVADFVRQIWASLGRKAASIGTLGVRVGESQTFGHFPAGMTTPDPVTLHRALAELSLAGFDHVAIEASSHGLDQYRLDAVHFTAAALTNVTRDHLDYHQDLSSYLEAKLRLFREVLPAGRPAILNADADSFEPARRACLAVGRPLASIGAGGEAIRLIGRVPTAAGQDLTVQAEDQIFRVHLPLIGEFQASNALIAAGLAIAAGEDAGPVIQSLSSLRSVPGRLELVGRHPNGAPVYVDYAHTPDALRNVLHAVRSHTAGCLALVFGCGGDRDTGKRPEMGAVASALADRIVVTDDNPRREDPCAIRQAILGACPRADEIGDRAEAIAAAVSGLHPDDVLLIAGKGHETGQIFADRTLPFDDREVARTALERIRVGRA